jgi:CBS domain containing-hemolysin-like protein
MLIRQLSRIYGDIDDHAGGWDFVAILSLLSSVMFWSVLFSAWCIPGVSQTHTFSIISKIAFASMGLGFILTGLEKNELANRRIEAFLVATVGMPGFVAVNTVVLIAVALWKLMRGFIRIQDGIFWMRELFSGKVLQRWKEKRRKLQDAKLKELASKVRVVEQGAYRMGAPPCKECGQPLPMMEVEDDRKKARHLTL